MVWLYYGSTWLNRRLSTSHESAPTSSCQPFSSTFLMWVSLFVEVQYLTDLIVYPCLTFCNIPTFYAIAGFHLPWVPEVFLERFPVSVTQKRHDRPQVSIVTRAGHIRDMTDTRNCARKTSGTQGSFHLTSSCSKILIIDKYSFIKSVVWKQMENDTNSLITN